MHQLYLLDSSLDFPPLEDAMDEPNGLIAFGGDLSCERLLSAYYNGIFPWFSAADPILWWSPDPRAILPLSDFHLSKSMRKFVNKCEYKVTLNHDFKGVIESCAKVSRKDDGTWILPQMQQAYTALHTQGHAHSIEVWQDEKLVGGLYGVAVGGIFCGESMFHVQSNTSKLAYYYLVEHMKSIGALFIDCQIQNPHLVSLGSVEVTRESYQQALFKGREMSTPSDSWSPKVLRSLTP